MARAGILYSHVAQAAGRLATEGKNPTVDNVREALGDTGSKSTIGPMLKRWKAEHEDVVVETELGIPTDLLQAMKGIYEKLQGDAQHKIDEAHKAHQAEMQTAVDHAKRLAVDNQTLIDNNMVLTTELERVKAAFTNLQVDLHEASVALAASRTENGGLQQRLADRASEVGSLIDQLTQGRMQFEHYQEATARQRSEDRQAVEQRITRLEQDIAGAQSRLVAQQTMIGQQEARLAQLVADNHRLQEAARQAEEALIAVKTGRDHLSYQVKELTASRDEAGGKLDAAQIQLTDMRTALAVRDKEIEMLTIHLTRETGKVEALDLARRTLLQENTQLLAKVAAKQGQYDEKSVPEPR